MKPLYFFIAVPLILFVGVCYWWYTQDTVVKNTPKTVPKEDLVIVAIGDSLVEGVGATAGHDFVSLLSQKIAIPITNLGVGGDTSSQVLARLDEALDLKPHIVILLVGGNDALQKIRGSAGNNF